MSRADIILKLAVGKDKRTVAPVETGGHISYFFRTFTAKIKNAFLINIIYTAIFALPLLFSAFVLPTIVDRLTFTGKSFISNLGIGFPGVADDLNASISELFHWYRILVFPCALGSILIAFLGFAGLFHCSRGFMWDEKVKVKSFFRGIAKLWRPYLLTGLIVLPIAAAIMYATGWHFELLLTVGANAGSWIVFILSILVGVFTVGILIVLLPTFACYDFTFGQALGNAFKFFLITPIPDLFIAIFSIGIVLLALIGQMLAYLMAAVLALLGFVFFAMMWTTYGQYLFDAFIVPQVDQDGNRKVDVQRRLQTNKGESAKTVDKTQPRTKKTVNKNTYNSSYKRKPSNNNPNNGKNNGVKAANNKNNYNKNGK